MFAVILLFYWQTPWSGQGEIWSRQTSLPGGERGGCCSSILFCFLRRVGVIRVVWENMCACHTFAGNSPSPRRKKKWVLINLDGSTVKRKLLQLRTPRRMREQVPKLFPYHPGGGGGGGGLWHCPLLTSFPETLHQILGAAPSCHAGRHPFTPLSSVSHSPCVHGRWSQRSAFWTLNPRGGIKFSVRGLLGIFRALWLEWLKLVVSHNLGRLGHTTACKSGCGSISTTTASCWCLPKFSFGGSIFLLSFSMNGVQR